MEWELFKASLITMGTRIISATNPFHNSLLRETCYSTAEKECLPITLTITVKNGVTLNTPSLKYCLMAC